MKELWRILTPVVFGILTTVYSSAAWIYWVEADPAAPRLYRSDSTGAIQGSYELAAWNMAQPIAGDSVHSRLLLGETGFIHARIVPLTHDLVPSALLVGEQSVIRGIFYSPVTSFTYWTSSNLSTGGIICRLGSSAPIETLQTWPAGSMHAPLSIITDPAGATMYWSDFDAGAIYSTAVTKGASVVSLVTGLNGPWGIVFDADSAVVYWSELGSGTLNRIHANGSRRQVVLSGLNRPASLAIDTRNHRLIWAELGSGLLRSAKFDGTGTVTLRATKASITGVAVLATASATGIRVLNNSRLTDRFSVRSSAGGFIRVHAELSKPGMVKISLSDAQGRMVRTMQQTLYAAGHYDIDMPGIALPAGYYRVSYKMRDYTSGISLLVTR